MTSPRRTRVAAAALAGVLAVLGTGCQVGAEDDELQPPRRTVTASPSPARTAAPRSVPVGDGPVSVRDVVWSQGSRLHVNRRSVELAPLTISAFVVVDGGVYLLDRGELRFTDLSRVRSTGLTDLTGLDIEADRSRIRVTSSSSTTTGGSTGGSAYTYDTRSGRVVDDAGYAPASETDRLGSRATLRVRGGGALSGRRGPGRFAVALDRSGSAVAVDTATRTRVQLRGASTARFDLAGWAGADTFYGTAGSGRTRSVTSCDVVRRVCTDLGPATGTDPVLFGTGR